MSAEKLIEGFDEVNAPFSEFHGLSYAIVAMLAWLSYDILLTFSQEIDVIWRRKWTFPKFLYLVVRYYAFVHLVVSIAVDLSRRKADEAVVVGLSHWSTYRVSFLNSCIRWMGFFFSGPTVVVPLATDALLIIRINALYNNNRKLLALLVCLWICTAALEIRISVLVIDSITFTTKPGAWIFPGCPMYVPESAERNVLSLCFGLMVQLLCFILTLFKYYRSASAIGSFEEKQSTWQVVKQTKRLSPLVALFLRDGTVAFFLICATTAINVIFVMTLEGALTLIGSPVTVATSAVLASRLYLNLCGFVCGAPPATSSTGYERYDHDFPSLTSSHIEFARSGYESELVIMFGDDPISIDTSPVPSPRIEVDGFALGGQETIPLTDLFVPFKVEDMP